MSSLLVLLKVYWRFLFSIVCFPFLYQFPVKAGGVEVTNYGHSALLISGGGKKILLNPFKSVGCAEGLQEPKLKVNVVLASSQLADEGARVAKGLFLVNPGSYRVGNLKIEGFAVDHDRLGGRRFGQGVIWQWEQGGLSFAHLGGVAGSLGAKEKVLLGSPDVLILAVGGGAKVYNPKEALQVITDLNPKRVIPVQYSTSKTSGKCDLKGIQPFLDLMPKVDVKKVGRSHSFSEKLSNQLVITLFE
tara:strand:+ start:2070 stop:2807 length:738 start_codon:yes stop_codon:yes gene_type:complete